MKTNIRYSIANTSTDYQHARELFREYVRSLNVDLSFQSFEQELTALDKQYSNPDGGLLLAYDDIQAIGCVGIRKLDNEIAELKRMYVKIQYRGNQIGVHLLKQSIELAQKLGYKKIRLDTLANMRKAQDLYRSFGFIEISSYRFNPIEGTIYMEKDL